jgi:hypothetical protein
VRTGTAVGARLSLLGKGDLGAEGKIGSERRTVKLTRVIRSGHPGPERSPCHN